MNRARRKNVDSRPRLVLGILLLLLFLFFTGCSPDTPLSPAPSPQDSAGLLQVHFLDMGQADCILVQAPSGKNMLIDAGNNDDAAKILAYLRERNIRKLDVVVGTHPHEDHIGSMDQVINTFEVGQVVMPNATHTTRTFKDVLTAIKNKGLKITTAKPEITLDLGTGINATVVAPRSAKYKDLNNYSVVIHLTYGSTSFLFTGDAEALSESEMLKAGTGLKSTVLKVGHHGSRTSSTQAFLDKVKPQYAVIMCGQDNDYGYPHRETLQKLAALDTQIFRTDLNGTIIATSDGTAVTFQDFPTPAKANTSRQIAGSTVPSPAGGPNNERESQE